MNFKNGDKVVVIAGKDKGKSGNITKVLREENKVIVSGINVVTKHVKPTGNQPGQKVTVDSPIHASNVMIEDPKTKKPTRIGHTTDKAGKKVRVTKKSNEILK
ncbi:MAG: 50S ribosomal protein L24 [Mycoplasmatota bacterium]